MTVKFRCELADGRVIIGPIQGCGGKIGDGCSHLSRARQAEAADGELRAVLRLSAKRGAQNRIFELEPGCCAVYPDHCAAADGEPIPVPLLGTRFEVCK